MSVTIDEVFIKQYESEVKAAYQRMGSLLRGTVRTRQGVNAKDLTFPKVGKGEAGQKTRHGNVPVMNLDWTKVEATIADWFAGEYADDLDLLKTNVDVRGENVRAASATLGRKTDDIIITAAVSGSNSTTLTATGTKAAFHNSVIEAVEALMTRDVPPDSMITAAISWRMWSWMLQMKEFASSDYTGPSLQPFMAGGRALQGKTWMGVHWITHSGLPKSGNNRTNILYHADAIGHAIQRDITTNISWENTKDAFFLNSKIAMGAVLIDGDGVQEMVLDESQALALT